LVQEEANDDLIPPCVKSHIYLVLFICNLLFYVTLCYFHS
jgi:hypothetical protein